MRDNFSTDFIKSHLVRQCNFLGPREVHLHRNFPFYPGMLEEIYMHMKSSIYYRGYTCSIQIASSSFVFLTKWYGIFVFHSKQSEGERGGRKWGGRRKRGRLGRKGGRDGGRKGKGRKGEELRRAKMGSKKGEATPAPLLFYILWRTLKTQHLGNNFFHKKKSFILILCKILVNR